MELVTVISHAFAFILYLCVTIFLCTKIEVPLSLPLSLSANKLPNWHFPNFAKHQKQSWLLILSCAATAIWGLCSIFFVLGYMDYGSISIIEIYNTGLWCACLISLLQGASLSKHKQWFFDNYAIAAIAIFCASLALFILYGPLWFLGMDIEGTELDKISLMGQLLLSIISLALVEQVFRNTKKERRWGIKFLCIGLFLLYAYDFYLYANSVLFQVIDLQLWQSRGFICALTAPFVALTAIRDREWTRDLFPSHTVVFKSATVVICGFYLLAMGSIGYFIRLFGGNLGEILEIVFMFAATLVLLVLITSAKIRSALKLVLAKNWFKLRYDYKEEWLAFTEILSHQSADQSLGTRTIMALANMCESPSGLLFEIDTHQDNEAQLTFKSSWNRQGDFFDLKEPIDSPFCQFLTTNHVIALNQPSVAIPSWLSQLPWAWLVIPLLVESRSEQPGEGNGQNYVLKLHGFVVLAHPRVSFNINWEVLDLLRVAGRQATICLVQAQTSEQLSIAKQFESYNKLATFVMHDLKNIVTQLSLLSSNAKKHKDNPRFIESTFKTIDNAISQIERMNKQIRNKEKNTNLTLNLHVLMQNLLQSLPSQHILYENMSLSSQQSCILANYDDCYHILSHLIENAHEAIIAASSAKAEGANHYQGLVKITLCDTVALLDPHAHIAHSDLLQGMEGWSQLLDPKLPKEDTLCLLIEDNGCGMSSDFINNGLFKPFVTTKSYKGMGIGVFEAKSFVDSIGGSLKVKSKPEVGTLFLLQFLKVKDNHCATTNITDHR